MYHVVRFGRGANHAYHIPSVFERDISEYCMNRWLFHCRAEDLSDRYEVWLEVAIPQLGTDETALKEYAAYVYKTRVCANLPTLGGDWRARTHAIRHRQMHMPFMPLTTNIFEVLNRTIVLGDKGRMR